MQIIHCEYCGNSNLPFDVVHVNLELNRSRNVCEHCNNIVNEKQDMMFCTIGCLVEYMKQVLDGNKELKWKEYEWQKVTNVNTAEQP